MSYSNMCEDMIVHRLFEKQPARFLDLGAGDGVTLSNTLYLAEEDWTGVWIDANPDNYASLMRHAAPLHGRVEILMAAVAAKRETRPIWIPKEPLIATLSKELQDRGHERTGARQETVNTLRVADIAAKYPGNFDFINIDIDGLCLEVMRDIDYKALGTWCVCIEFLTEDVLGVDERPVILDYMKTRGFRKIAETPENLILWRSQ